MKPTVEAHRAMAPGVDERLVAEPIFIWEDFVRSQYEEIFRIDLDHILRARGG